MEEQSLSKNFLLIDIYNLFFRASYSIKETDNELMKGMLLHMMFYMMKKACNKFNPDHIIICSDGGGSWRKEIYPPYKQNRLDKLQEKTPQEVLKDETLMQVFTEEFIPFIKEKTNISFLKLWGAEADDLITGFIKNHPSDNHIILSTDNDFVQLLSDNVIIYNSMEDRLITKDCIIDAQTNKPINFSLKDGKIAVCKSDITIKDQKLVPSDDWVEYALFMKCIRGDKSDNIFSAYPGCREKSTKNKIGMREAFENRIIKGFSWVSFMNQKWEDIFGQTKLVKDVYELNNQLIDLNNIPEDLKEKVDEHIKKELKKDEIKFVGINLTKFFDKWNLLRLKNEVQSLSNYFSKGYI